MVKLLSIIIPVYNEERLISKALREVVMAKTPLFKKEIIIIDDGSTDKTKAEVKKQIIKYAKKNVKIFLLEKPINQGKGKAVKTGFIKSKGDIVLVQDADLEYDPADYGILLGPFLEKDADVVYGSRFISNHPHRILYFWHQLGNNFLTLLSNIFTNLNFSDMETGLKAFDGNLIRKLAKHLQSGRFGFEPEITALIAKKKNLKIYEVGVSYQGRTYAEGKKIGWKDGIEAIYIILKSNLFRQYNNL